MTDATEIRGAGREDGAALLALQLALDAETDLSRLYERAGFTSEGVRRGSLRVDGALLDEIAMARVG